MNKKEYNEWIDSKLSSFSQVLPDKTNPNTILSYRAIEYCKRTGDYCPRHTMYIGHFFICVDIDLRKTVIYNVKTGKSGVAKCRIDDTMTIREGIAIAWARYNHEIVPNWANSIPREELANGDKFISSVNQNNIFTFIGWLPNVKNGLTGKWAIVIDDYYKPIKTQIANEVVKVD